MDKNYVLSFAFAFFLLFSTRTTFAIPPENQETIYLSYNENPFGTFPSIKAAMEGALNTTQSYPDEPYEKFLTQLAAYHSVETDQIFISSGLSSSLSLATEAFLGQDKKLIMALPTFEFIKFYAKARGSQVIEIPLNKEYAHHLDHMLAQVDSTTKLVYICNPNNPTGSLTPRSQMVDFIKKLPPDVYVFIDEAYHHFAAGLKGYTSFIDEPLRDDRVIVGRSFSKIYGLAGMRLGYIISTPATIKKLKSLSAIDTVNSAVLSGGCAALKDKIMLQETVQKFHEAKTEFCRQAQARGLDFIPSYGNFIMLETNGKTVQEVIKHFKQNHILIGREFPGMDHHVRVSFGTPVQMEKFWQVWDLIK